MQPRGHNSDSKCSRFLSLPSEIRVSVPAALGVLQRLHVPRSVPLRIGSYSQSFFSLCCGWRSVQRIWICSIAVLRDDMISSSLSMKSWCPWLRITHLLAQCLGLIHPQRASTAFVPSVHHWAQESSTTLHFFSGSLARFQESSNPSLFCDKTDSISNSQNFSLSCASLLLLCAHSCGAC